MTQPTQSSTPDQRVRALVARELHVDPSTLRTGQLVGDAGVIVSVLRWDAEQPPGPEEWIAARSYFVTADQAIYKLPSSAATPLMAERHLADPQVRRRALVSSAGPGN